MPEVTPRSLASQGIELLAPARDLECGVIAINCGADAVYIGAPRFGARVAAGNALPDIRALVEHAHRFWARVYVTLNTLLYDAEIQNAVDLAWQLYETGIDGMIIQDTGLLECELPPLPLIASTQTHNHTPERVAFLEQVGFRRAILARELSLDQIRAIHKAAPSIELECFVHGALCVCYSGQCYLSYAVGGRSGNRGECAQPCRKRYDLLEGDDNRLIAGRHLLSVRDLKLSGHLAELADAGVTSFKIEGRLKDARYVANVVAAYSEELKRLGLPRTSSGESRLGFQPDLNKTFNRGFTTYFLNGRIGQIGSHRTPKMVGERIGRVSSLHGKAFVLDAKTDLHPGDGLCFFDAKGELQGTLVNAVSECIVTPSKMNGILPGAEVFRNYDHQFMSELDRSTKDRRIEVTCELSDTQLIVRDADGNAAAISLPASEPANNAQAAIATLRKQLQKTGNTEFSCSEVVISAAHVPFLPVSAINALRREALGSLSQVRAQNSPKPLSSSINSQAAFPDSKLTYRGNVLNRKAAAFYARHGVTEIAPAAESGLDMHGLRVMTTRYCLRYELGHCPKETHQPITEQWFLEDEQGNRLPLRFDCAKCEMQVYFGKPRPE